MFKAAQCNGVRPSLSFVLGSAPYLSNSSAISTEIWLFFALCAPVCSGVTPLLSLVLGSAPYLNNSSAISTILVSSEELYIRLLCSGVPPKLVFALTSAPCLSNNLKISRATSAFLPRKIHKKGSFPIQVIVLY